jgi:hypothetical protein
MVKVILRLIIPLLTLVFGQFDTLAQTRVQKSQDLAVIQLENVQIKAHSIGSFFSTLALSSDIPIGLEIAFSKDTRTPYAVDFKKGTLSELLTQFVTEHTEYAWEIRDGAVNVFPKKGYRVALFEDLLKTRIGRFSVKENTSCAALVESLITTSEITKVLNVRGAKYRAPDLTGFYIPQVGRKFVLEVSNSTMKSILNRVVRLSPTAKFWVIATNSDGSLNVSLAANHEDAKKEIQLWR